MTDRKPPSIQLSRLDPGGAGRGWSVEAPAFHNDIDLADPRRFEGVLLRRFCAAGVDFTIAFILSCVLWLANCMATIATLGLLSLPALVLAPIVIHVAMATYLMAEPRGATLGMRAAGLNARGAQLTAFVLSGGLVALGAILLAGSTATGDPKSGDPYLLNAIAAVALAGASFTGGR